MDREARSRLRRVVIQSRGLLEEDFRTQLKRLGIEEGGKTIPVGRLQHLTPDDRTLREKILTAIDKEQGKKIRRTEAYDRYVRHVGFTYLNRVAALRAMEVRELLSRETVARRDQYAGMSERAYLIAESEGLSDPGEIIRRCLIEAFDEVSQEIKVLFDMGDEYSLLFPGIRVLDQVIELLSVEVPREDWLEDDIIGWIYQYYNSEARSEFRKRRRKPRADDIPVINQFYTPRWLVRALVDNTLGRLWLEMKGRMPKPGEAEAPSEERLRNPQGDTVDEYCSYLILPRQDHPPREEKSVREIKVLDPACGSGHFLVYAFNVLYRMYLEDEPDTSREEVSKLILENNLYGIDIDLRSVQLAALSLYLKAKEYNPGVKIERMNLVCADARIIDGELQKEFLKSLEPDLDLQKVFTKLFDELEYTYDVGSLLKVREPFERLLNERGLAQVRFHSRREASVPVKPAVSLEEMLEALVRFEREGIEKKDMGTLLFSSETGKSIGLLSLLSLKYDVILMNPPYGKMPETTKKYLRKLYVKTHFDYYAAFIEQSIDLLNPLGYVGALTGRTFMFLKSYEWTRDVLLSEKSSLQILFDLGFNILDEATARWAAFITRKNLNEIEILPSLISFMKLTDLVTEKDRIRTFRKILSDMWNEKINQYFYESSFEQFKLVPGIPLSYWVPQNIRAYFEKFPPLDSDLTNKQVMYKIADVKRGLDSGDNKRFLRYFWEVDPNNIGINKKWIPFAKGGADYFYDINLVINWENNGQELRNNPNAYLRNEGFHFKPGLTWARIVSSTRMNASVLPPGCLFDSNASGIFPCNQDSKFSLLGFLQSLLCAFMLGVLDPLAHTRQVGNVAKIPINPKIMKNNYISSLAQEAYHLYIQDQSANETSTVFSLPLLLQILKNNENKCQLMPKQLFLKENYHEFNSTKYINNIKVNINDNFTDLLNLCTKRMEFFMNRISKIYELIDEEIYKLYDVNDSIKLIIKNELYVGKLKLKIYDANEMGEDKKTFVKDQIVRLLSYYIISSIKKCTDGIITSKELITEIKKSIHKDFKYYKLDEMEYKIEKIIDNDFENWLIDEYFNFHITLYKRRPVIWQLSSRIFSQNRSSKGAFNCFLYYHKLDRDTIPKIRTRQEYLKGLLDGAKWKTDRLRRELQEVKETGNMKRENQLQGEYEEAMDEYLELLEFDKKLEEVSTPRDELTEFDEDTRWVIRKIAEVMNDGWNPSIDYGVLVNITPLKEAGLLHPAANRVK